MTTQIQDRHRYPVLDSLRGLAALSVLLTHTLQKIVPSGVLNHTPIRMLVDGRCFVIFFFVLSGFVLATALWSQSGKLPYIVYVARRFVRLYPPYAAAGLLAIVALWLSGGDWGFANLRDYLLTLGTTQGTAIDIPSWSLSYELHLSLFMPLICLLIARNARLLTWATAALFIAVEICILKMGLTQFPYATDDLPAAVIVTLRFAICFAVGALLAWSHMQRSTFLPFVGRYPAIASALACLLMSVLLDQTSLVGAAVIIVLAIQWKAMQDAVAFKPFIWLGRISYSLYLTHFIVLEFFVRVLNGKVPLLVSVMIAFLTAFIVAEIFHRLVEAPAIGLSRRIGGSTRILSPSPSAH